jgi:hypothetical protein
LGKLVSGEEKQLTKGRKKICLVVFAYLMLEQIELRNKLRSFYLPVMEDECQRSLDNKGRMSKMKKIKGSQFALYGYWGKVVNIEQPGWLNYELREFGFIPVALTQAFESGNLTPCQDSVGTGFLNLSVSIGGFA